MIKNTQKHEMKLMSTDRKTKTKKVLKMFPKAIVIKILFRIV